MWKSLRTLITKTFKTDEEVSKQWLNRKKGGGILCGYLKGLFKERLRLKALKKLREFHRWNSNNRSGTVINVDIFAF